MSKTPKTLSRIALAMALTALPTLAGEGRMNYSVGLTYVSGMQDVVDFYTTEHSAESTSLIPVGLMLTPYYEMSNGLRFCFDLGPVAVVLGDIHYTDVPVGASLGYTFIPSSDVSPYVRAGVRQHLVSGTDVDGSTVGGFAALGIDFSRNRRIHWGFEVAVDTSTVNFTSTNTVYNPALGTTQNVVTIQKIKPDKFMAGIHVIF